MDTPTKINLGYEDAKLIPKRNKGGKPKEDDLTY